MANAPIGRSLPPHSPPAARRTRRAVLVIAKLDRPARNARFLLSGSPHDLSKTVGMDGPTSNSREVSEILRRRGVGNVVVRLGNRRALMVRGAIDTAVPAAAVEIADTTAADDAFNAAFAVTLAEGRPMLDAVRYGSPVAG